MPEEKDAKQSKDIWDKLSIVSTALIPAAIALAGFFYSNAVKRAEDKANESKNTRDAEIATINSQVNQAQLLATFMEPLLSPDTLKQAIAINAILIGVPVQGKQIVDLIARSKSKGATVQQIASTALVSRRTELIKTLYSTDNQARINAAGELASSWIKDEGAILEIMKEISGAMDNPTRYPNATEGIFNSFIVLQNADAGLLAPVKDGLQGLIAKIPAANEKTKAEAGIVMSKIK